VNRYRLSIAVAAALIPLAVPVPAQAARGSFVYWTLSPGGDPAGDRHQLNDPPTGSCQQLGDPDQSAGAQVIKVENDTDTEATVYETKDCTGHHLIVPAKATKKAGGHGPHSFGSVKFRL
jgi:hypothetical protein